MEPSKKRPLSPGAGTSKQNSSSSHHYINDPSLSLPSLTHTASSERFNLPPLSSLTQFGGPVLTPPIHAHVRGSLANGSPSPQSSAKRLRLDDTVAAAERDRPSFGSPGAADVTAQQRRLSLHSSAELPDIAALAALTNRSGHKLPPPPRSMVPPVKANPQANNNRLPVPYSNPSSVPHMLPSMPAFNSNESLPKRSRNSPTPHGVVADPSRYGPPMMGVGYPPNMNVANGKVNSSVPVSMPSMTHGGMPMPRLNFPLLNASSPVSKIPKPPPVPGYGREMAMAPGNASSPAGLNMAHYPHSASTTISPFSSGAFGVPPYGANYYTDLRRSAPSQLRPPNIQPQRVPPAGPAKSPVMQSPYQNVTALLQAAQNEFGTRSSDRHGEDDGFGSGQREGMAQTKVLAMPPKTEFEAKFEQAAKEAKRRCKPGDVAVVNDERLLRVPRGWRERSLGYVVYKGPTLRHPTSTHPDDIQLFLLPPFGPEHHYATVEVRIPARWLLYRNNVALRKGAVWGTDVYTDDSDVVAVVTHAGWYKCGDDPHARLQRQATPSVKTEPPSTNESVVPSVESRATPAATDGIVDNDAARKEKDRVSSASFPTPPTPAIYRPLAASAALPDHDLIVTLRVLPRLVKYTGSLRNGIHSRGWGGGHDGESIRVEKVEMVERGVEKKGRGNGVKQWLEGVKEFKLRTTRSSDDNDDSDFGRSRSDFDEGRSDTSQYNGHDEDEEDDGHVDGAEGNKWMHQYAEDGWPASEPAEGFGGVTLVWSENGEACLKYSPRLLVNWPPYLHEKSFNGKEVPLATPNRPTLSPAAWKELLSSRPYWCIRLGYYEDTLVMDTADQERVEIAKKPSAVEREIYVIKRLGGTSICVEPERIAFDEDECVIMGSDGAVERRFPVVRFFWKRQQKDREESSVG